MHSESLSKRSFHPVVASLSKSPADKPSCRRSILVLPSYSPKATVTDSDFHMHDALREYGSEATRWPKLRHGKLVCAREGCRDGNSRSWRVREEKEHTRDCVAICGSNPRRGSDMSLLAVISDPPVVGKVLRHLAKIGRTRYSIRVC
jgi:hypothetical protein